MLRPVLASTGLRMRRRHGAHDPHEVATVHGTKTLRPTVPRAASLKISRRVCGMLVSIVLVFFMADHILIGRLFRNPLLVFCLCLSLVSFVVSVLFPRDDSISRPVVVAVFVTWCIMCIRISATDWDQRPHEPSTRTALRRFVCVTWTSCTVMTTLAYISELLVSSWATIRAIFIISAGMDVVHTACIHLLYTIDPLNQPTKPIFHTSGVRVGPPTITSYLGPLYILVVVSLLNARRREAISRFTGGSTLSIGLGQLRAEELSSLQKPTTSARAQGANGGIASSSSSQDNSPPEALRQAVLAAVRSIDTRCQSYDCVELNSGELRSRLEEITEAKARLDEARLSTRRMSTPGLALAMSCCPSSSSFPSTLLLTFDLALCPVHRSFGSGAATVGAPASGAPRGPDRRVG